MASHSSGGEHFRASLKLPPQILAGVITDLLERKVEDEYRIKLRNSRLEMDVKPFEIVTLKLLLQKTV